jgi:hypothetical protein
MIAEDQKTRQKAIEALEYQYQYQDQDLVDFAVIFLKIAIMK